VTRKAFLKKYCVRFAAAFALLCLLFYTVYHVLPGSADSLMTLPVREVTDRQLITADAYLFREEQVLTVPAKGLVNELVENGAKVKPESAVAEVRSGAAATLEKDQITLDRVNRLIRVLEDSAVSGSTNLSAAQLFRKAAGDCSLSVQKALANGDWAAIGALEEDMLIQLNRYVTVTEDGVAIEQTLARLREVRANLLTGSAQILTSAERAGYYYHRSHVDGYESLFTPEVLEELTAERFASLVSASPVLPEGQVAGKLVYGYEWSLAIPLNAAQREQFSSGGSYSFQFPDNGDREIALTCTRMIEGADGGAIGVFEAIETPPDFVYFRTQRVRIVTGSCEGYYVPEAALQDKDGVQGVYVFRDNVVVFCRIEVLYAGDGYCIVSKESEGEDSLGLYDILITSGKNLYEGRIYR